jgi:hypothetical protein
MQLIRAVPVSAARYASENFHRTIEPPDECPHCGAHDTLEALGYYSRNTTNTKRGVLRISVRRFRCRKCRRTVSILPSFAQPYRLVLNATINEYFGGTLNATALSWLSLLKQYWNRYAAWFPKIENILRSVTARSPPQTDATAWWEIIAAVFDGVEGITMALVGQFGVTLFGRYRCHSPRLARPARPAAN